MEDILEMELELERSRTVDLMWTNRDLEKKVEQYQSAIHLVLLTLEDCLATLRIAANE